MVNRGLYGTSMLEPGSASRRKKANRVSPVSHPEVPWHVTDQEEYEAAAHILNLAEFSEAEQPEKGRELARQLAEIFQRGEWLSVSDLPGREDAVIEDSSGQNPRVGEARRNIEVSSMQANGETYDIRLGRYRVGEQEPVWLIMPLACHIFRCCMSSTVRQC